MQPKSNTEQLLLKDKKDLHEQNQPNDIFLKSFSALMTGLNNVVKEAMSEGGTLLFTTFVQSDGEGDLLHFIDACSNEVLAPIEGLQHFKILRIILCPNTLEKETVQRLQKNKLHDSIHVIYYYDDTMKSRDYLAMLLKSYLESNQKLAKDLSEVSAIFNISTDLMSGVLEKAGIKKPGMQCVTLGEHGGASVDMGYDRNDKSKISPTVFTNNTSIRNMGFSQKHHGIFIKPPKILSSKAQSLSKIQDIKFLQLLLKSRSTAFDEKQMSEFLKTSMLIPGYLQGGPGSFIMICLSILGSDIARRQNFNEVVFVVNKGNYAEERFSISTLKTFRVKKLEVIDIHSQTDNDFKASTKTIQVSPQGITLRIIQNYRLQADDDYENLVKSAHLYGCSGDKTLEMAISNKIIPIFQAKAYKGSFLKELTRVIQAFEKQDPQKSVSKFFDMLKFLTPQIYRQCSDEVRYAIPRNIAKELNFDFLQAWPKVVEHLHQHHNFYTALPLIIKQTVYNALLEKALHRDHNEVRRAALSTHISLIEHELTKKEQQQCREIFEKIEADKLGDTMDLTRANLSPDHFISVCQKLEPKRKITKLMLDANPYSITSKAWDALIQLLSKHRSFYTIHLSLNGITDEMFKALMPALQANPITELNIANNPLKREGLKQIAKLMSESKTLKILYLGLIELDLECIKHLCEGIAATKSLKALDLRYCGITNAGAKLIAAALKKNKSINQVCFQADNTITDDLLLQEIKALTDRNQQSISMMPETPDPFNLLSNLDEEKLAILSQLVSNSEDPSAILSLFQSTMLGSHSLNNLALLCDDFKKEDQDKKEGKKACSTPKLHPDCNKR